MSFINLLLGKVFGYKLVRTKSLGHNPYHDVNRLIGKENIKTVFDVGANEGQTTLKLLKFFPKASIYSFEPGKEAFYKLNNRFVFESVKAINMGMGEKKERLELIRHESSVTDSFLEDCNEDNLKITKSRKIINKEKVEVTSIDEFCSENGIDYIDLLKIDTQGFEKYVLKGASNMLKNKKIKAIVMEICFSKIYKEQTHLSEIAKAMENYHYSIVDFYDKARVNGKTISWCDMFYIDLNNM